jgi:hypothetical protein
MTEPDQLSRRRLLGLVGAGALGVATGGAVTWRLNRSEHTASTGASVAVVPDTTTTSTTAETTVETTTTTEPPLLQTERYAPVSDEVFVEAKLAGVRLVEELMTYSAGEDRAAPIDRALALGLASLAVDEVARAAEVLHVPDMSSSARVVYPQLGGLDPHRDPVTGSIMVVVVQRFQSDAEIVEVSRCVDVRVRKVDEAWGVEALADTSGVPVTRSHDLSDEALRVLEHGAIDMPDSVRWDIYDGIVDRRILTEMADLADQTPIGVTTCMRGHPVNVFATPNRSAHSVGRAVDIWAVGDRPVVQQRDDPTSVAYQVAESLFDGRRIHRLGAPWAFDGVGGRSWTDPVHLDHLHLGVSG